MKRFISISIFIITIIAIIIILKSVPLKHKKQEVVPVTTTTASKPTVEKKQITPNTFTTWIHTDSVTNIRSEATTNSPMVLQVPKDSWFPVVKKKGKWDLIQLGNQQTAWIADWVVKTEKLSSQSQVVHTASNTPLGAGPDATFKTWGTADATVSYMPMKVGGEWVELLRPNNGKSIWVPVKDVQWNHGTIATPITVTVSIVPISPSTDKPLAGKLIVVDAGHGGKDVGATGKYKSLKINEREVNLSVAKVLQNKLEASGAHVIMTRTSNDQHVTLGERTQISNDEHADAFISIHQNMFPQDHSITGTITYYYDAATSKLLAQDIEKQALVSLHSHEAKNQISQEELYVLHHNTQPSILIEGCFLSNPQSLENSIQPTFQENLASGIYHGILEYFQKLN